MKKLLYIPFSDEESNAELFYQSVRWKADHKKIKEREDFAIHIFSEDEQYDLTDTKYVYILAHGDSKLRIYNTSSSNEEIISLTMKELTRRFNSSMYNGEKLEKIKLYFCDPTHGRVSELRAKQFREQLRERFLTANIEYYTATIYPTQYGVNGNKKRATAFFSGDSGLSISMEEKASENRVILKGR